MHIHACMCPERCSGALARYYREGVAAPVYTPPRIAFHTRHHLYVCGHARRSAVGDMFVGHDLLPTSATVNLVVTASTPSAVRREGGRSARCCADADLGDVEVAPRSFRDN